LRWIGIGGRIVTNLSYADDIILLAISEAEPHELVDCLDRVSRKIARKYSLLINVDKIKVMTSDGIACRILIQNEQLEQIDTFPYLGSLITEDGECTTEFCTKLNRRQALRECKHPPKLTIPSKVWHLFWLQIRGWGRNLLARSRGDAP